jgi:hypothetical protein
MGLEAVNHAPSVPTRAGRCGGAAAAPARKRSKSSNRPLARAALSRASLAREAPAREWCNKCAHESSNQGPPYA